MQLISLKGMFLYCYLQVYNLSAFELYNMCALWSVLMAWNTDPDLDKRVLAGYLHTHNSARKQASLCTSWIFLHLIQFYLAKIFSAWTSGQNSPEILFVDQNKNTEEEKLT